CVNPDDMHFEGAKPGVKFALGENPRQVNFGGGGRRNAGNDAPAVRYPATRMGVETLIRDRFTAAREYDRVWREYKQASLSANSTDDEQQVRVALIGSLVKTENEATRID